MDLVDYDLYYVSFQGILYLLIAVLVSAIAYKVIGWIIGTILPSSAGEVCKMRMTKFMFILVISYFFICLCIWTGLYLRNLKAVSASSSIPV